MKSKEEIAQEFHSFETGKPFSNCIECERALDESTSYIVEKAIKQYDGYAAKDTLFDYAICMSCAQKMQNELSANSRLKMSEFLMPHLTKLTQASNDSLEKCLVTGKPIRETGEYQIYAFFRGSELVSEIPPYAISEEAVEMMLPLLSKETTDFLDGFFKKHFSPDPSLMEPVGPKILLV